MLGKFIRAGVLIAVMTTNAFAQGVSMSPFNVPPPAPTHEEIEKQQALDRAYRSATTKIPDKKVVNDPWSDVRPSPDSSTASKKKPQ
jgi:hypothetical protein